MMEVGSLGVKAPVSLRYSSLEEREGVAKYATGHHIFIFMKIKGIKTFFKIPNLCLGPHLVKPWLAMPL